MFNRRRLIIRNLAYHWRGNLAVGLGVVVGAAVLTGALLVGDSLRGSLRDRIERQLAGIDSAAFLFRPVPAAIANETPGAVAPVLMLPGSLQVVAADEAVAPILGRITVLGVDDRFKPSAVGQQVDWNGSSREVVLSDRVARKLGVHVGEKVKLGVERSSDIPRTSSLSRRTAADVMATAAFTVTAVLPPEAAENDFNLQPNPTAPLNVFVPLRSLDRLVFGDAEPRVNTLLASGASVESLNEALRRRLDLKDYGLKLREADRGDYLSVESANLVMSPGTVESIQAAASELQLHAEPTVVYIADSLSHGGKEIPYPVVAGLNPAAAPPLGPFLPPDVSSLADNEVVLLDWKGSSLNGLPAGSKIAVAYYDPEVEGEGQLRHAELTLRGYIALKNPTEFRDLTPEVKGITDAGARLNDLDRPPVLPNKKIRERVPDNSPRAQFFNSRSKATPMAFVNLATGERLFGSRYGAITSVRIAPNKGESLEHLADRFRPVLVKHLDPKSFGLAFEPIRQRLLTASQGGTDFDVLFLGFSLFLIAAALMLVGLLFRLTLDRRATEVGLLLAEGFAVRDLRRVLLTEGLVLTIVGALVGLAVGIAYNHLLILVLVGLWPDKEVGAILHPHATFQSFALGFLLTFVMALGAIWLGLRGLVRVPPPALLRGETLPPATGVKTGSPIAWGLLLTTLPAGIVLLLWGRSIDNPDFQAMTFFGGGGLLLTAGLAVPRIWMKRTRHAVVNGRGATALARLGSRNAARNPTRSLLTAALLASAAFLLVAVESFRRQPGNEFLDKNGGSGGFNLVAETDVPIFEPFDSGPGRADLDKRLLDLYGGNACNRYEEALATLKGIEVYSLRRREGDDASCLNLFQAAQPRVLGVSDRFIDRGGFKFYATEADSPSERDNPWILLQKPLPNGVIPVFCEQNTAEWMLKKAVGDELIMPGDDGRELTLRIVGTLSDSPFQSELIMSDASFARAFPHTAGYREFLIRTPTGQEEAVGRVLTLAFRDQGLIAAPTRERVATYQAVIGAYLSTFQLLGGLGLLLGVMGLAVVVLRGVWERTGELALLRAMGYRPRQLQFLVLSENACLLVAGLVIGVLAALASVAPHVAEGAAVPWARLGGLLGLVVLVGLAVASAATAGVLRVPVIPALRKE